jgi:2-amino-4-hydroxy-6-hydroxymethyldihydropteridine diphosphokinase
MGWSRVTHPIYLSLGANLGAREENLNRALTLLPPAVEVLAVSRLYETAPAYRLDQPPFLNLAVKGQTALSPAALLAHLKQIEATLGRRPGERYGPRPIDLDILFYADRVIETPLVTIPHPRLAERGFVLYPLAEIAPDLLHPHLKQTVRHLLADLPGDAGILRVIER